METKKQKLTLDMDPEFQRRLKTTAALKGVSMRQYCLAAINREMVRDEVNADEQSSKHAGTLKQTEHSECAIFNSGAGSANSPAKARVTRTDEDSNPVSAHTNFGKPERFKIGELMALRDEISRGKVFSSNSVELLREAREIRAKEMEGWA